MGRLIDADTLSESLGCYPFMTTAMMMWFRHIIDEQETVKPEEGRWISAGSEGYECSNCWRTTKNPLIYCPSCGSKNDRGEIKNERSEKA